LPKYLGIDYGLKRVGIAVSDESLTISFPRDYLPNDSKLINTLTELVKYEGIGKIIIGMPVTMSGERSEQTEVTSQFSSKLKRYLEQNEISAEIDFIDERLTSRMAGAEIIRTVPRRSKRREKGLVDEMSAQIILQNYLDREKNLRQK
jgi:putative Holliday junction resolvase